MPVRIVKLTLLFFIIAGVLYFVSLNGEQATVSVGATNSVTGSVGTIVLTSFAFGVLLALLGGSIYAAQGYFRELQFKKREKKRLQLQRAILKTNQEVRVVPLEKAFQKYEALLAQNPNEPFLILEYARFLKTKGCFGKLQELITELKIRSKKDSTESYEPELYILGAEANLALGNSTGALDELSLLLQQHQDPFAARWAARLAFDAKRYEQAETYLLKAADNQPTAEDTLLAADIKASLIIRDTPDQESCLQKLLTFILQNESTVAYKEIARLQEQFGLLDEAAQSLVRLFKMTGDVDVLRRARSLWMSQGQSEKAISAIKIWERSATTEKNPALLELAKTYLLAGLDDQCLEILQRLDQTHLGTELKKDLVILKAMIAYRAKDSGASTIAFKEVERLAFEG